MRILIASAQFLVGGAETYAITVAEQLERLGHPTRIQAAHASDVGRELAISRGIELIVAPQAMLAGVDDVDAVIAQDAASAYAIAARHPRLPQVFVVHGLAGFEHPPGALSPMPTVVVMNDRIGKHIAAMVSRPRIERLHQPIDHERFRRSGPAREKARRVLVLSNYLAADRMGILAGVCDELGMEITRVGGAEGQTADPRAAIADADIVVGYGRSALEGMSMGRATYIWERVGGDGWVTPDNYAAMEADGFSGTATDAVIDAERLREDFAAYRPELGTFSYDLIRLHNTATAHVEALVGLLDRAEAPATGDVNATLSLLVRAETRTAWRRDGLEAEFKWMLGDRDSQRERAEMAERNWQIEHDAQLMHRAAREEAEAKLAEITSSTTWRLCEPLRRLGAKLRRLRR